MSETTAEYKRAFEEDDKSLETFLRSMRSFDAAFCQAMLEGTDFTLKLEVRGNKRKLLHSRVSTDRFERNGAERRFDGK